MEDVAFREGKTLSLAGGRFHEIAYVEWGDRTSARVVVCVHGLTRQGRDFDMLAQALARLGYRVVCPDVAGRGRSGRLPSADLYGLPQYAFDMTALIAHLGVREVDWIGTSMGGLIGMTMAAAGASPVRRLVLNDVGPFLPKLAVGAIGANVRGAPARYRTLEEGEARLRAIHAPFGPLTDDQWRHLARYSFVEETDGAWRPHYDPAIGEAFRGEIADVALWEMWDLMSCPTLVVRGASSDLLSRETADEMTRRGPRATLVEIAGCGHAPALMDDGQIALVVDWLGRAN